MKCKIDCDSVQTPPFHSTEQRGPNNRNLTRGTRGQTPEAVPKINQSRGEGLALNLASEWHLKWETAGAISLEETQKQGLCCTLSDGHRNNKAAGELSKGLYQSPAGFMFSHHPLWMFGPRLGRLVRLYCSWLTEGAAVSNLSLPFYVLEHFADAREHDQERLPVSHMQRCALLNAFCVFSVVSLA